MQTLIQLCTVALIVGATPEAKDGDATTGLVAHYAFDEGAGDILQDRSRNGHHGRIEGAAWAQRDGRPVLRFDGHGDYVDFGDNRELKQSGDLTILAWIHLDASPYPDGMTNWSIVDCESYCEEGLILRIDGAASKPMYRVDQSGTSQYRFGTTTLANRGSYLIGVVRRADTATLYVDGRPDGSFGVQDPVFGEKHFYLSSPEQAFCGDMGEVQIYNRALGPGEIAAFYWDTAGSWGKDTLQRGRPVLEPFVYYLEGKAIACIDFFGLLPTREDERIVVELAHQGGDALVSHAVEAIPSACVGDYAFDVSNLADGEYELRCVVAGPAREARATSAFTYPQPPANVPSPDDVFVGPLPPPSVPPELGVRVTASGGLVLTVQGCSFPIESFFSYPHGGEHAFTCEEQADTTWAVSSGPRDTNAWEVVGRGAHYSITRRIRAGAGRVVVSDTITNVGDEAVGILFRNQVTTTEGAFTRAFLAGNETRAPVKARDVKTNPTVFAVSDTLGIGLVALDDVYIVHSRGTFDERRVALGSNDFALDAGASYTLEWAVYINTTGDYYDLINAVRRDEGRNDVTVEGSLAFLQGTQQKRDAALIPAAAYFQRRNAAYATIFCLSWCADDPGISVEGIEFVEYPEECARIREMMERLVEVRPDVKGMFHVAHQLYATGQPDVLFPDSRVIDADGNQTVYPYEYANNYYFSKERYEDNWRWWIYYPTLDNSFGKAMLDSVDVMMDELGCRGVFVDGFLWGYGGEYTYDRWDGHSADIDPETKTIARKKGSTLLLTQDAMAAYCRKIWEKGGEVIANNAVITRTIGTLPLIVDKEISEGPYVHLAPTPIALGNPGAIDNEAGVYRDVRSKLLAGNLYFYYGDPAELTYDSVPKHMYPITVQEIHSGYIKGKERLVTMHSGMYGWENSQDLHQAFRYDARGHEVRAEFVTTVDADGVRTQIDLDREETAVLERLPIQLETPHPVNVLVEAYNGERLRLTVNGQGKATLKFADGTRRVLLVEGCERIEVEGSRSVRATASR